MGTIDYERIMTRINGLQAKDILVLFFITDNRGTAMSEISSELSLNQIEVSESITNLTSRGLIMNRMGSLISMV